MVNISVLRSAFSSKQHMLQYSLSEQRACRFSHLLIFLHYLVRFVFPRIQSLMVVVVFIHFKAVRFHLVHNTQGVTSFRRHHDFAASMPGFEIIHGCMGREAELGPITRDEKKVIVGCSLERIPLQRGRRYQRSFLIIRPHSAAPRPGWILKL